MYIIEWETLNWEMISSIVTAIATVVLAIFTIWYVRLLKKQADSRNRWELSVYFYNPLLSDLKKIVEIPNIVDQNYKGHDLGLKFYKQSESRLLLLLDKSFLERLITFDEKNEHYRSFVEYAHRKISEVLSQWISDQFGIHVEHIYGINLRIYPDVTLNRKSRNIYSFVLEEENPADWIKKMRELSIFKMKYDVDIEKGRVDHAFADAMIEFTLENFSDLYEFVQMCIYKDEELSEFFRLKGEVFKEANNLIEETELLIKKSK